MCRAAEEVSPTRILAQAARLGAVEVMREDNRVDVQLCRRSLHHLEFVGAFGCEILAEERARSRASEKMSVRLGTYQRVLRRAAACWWMALQRVFALA